MWLLFVGCLLALKLADLMSSLEIDPTEHVRRIDSRYVVPVYDHPDQCAWYFVNFVIDSILGVPIVWANLQVRSMVVFNHVCRFWWDSDFACSFFLFIFCSFYRFCDFCGFCCTPFSLWSILRGNMGFVRWLKAVPTLVSRDAAFTAYGHCKHQCSCFVLRWPSLLWYVLHQQ